MNAFTLVSPLIPLLGVIIVLVVIVKAIQLASGGESDELTGKSKYNYRRKQFFMTRSETAFYKVLVEAIGGEYFIFPQAHLPTMVNFQVPGQNWRGARSHINRNSVFRSLR